MERAHARLGPSSASRWISCPASINLSSQVQVEAAGPAATAGTIMHSAYERLLLGHHHLTTDEIESLVQCEVSESRARLIIEQGVTATNNAMLRFNVREFVTEIKVNPGARFGRADFWGTADVVGANADDRLVLVGDFKTGRGRVNVANNFQLMSYALGSLDLLDFSPRRVILAIFQPPIYGIAPALWETDTNGLLRFQDLAAKSAAQSDVDTLPQPSVNACMWCPAKSVCEAHEPQAPSA